MKRDGIEREGEEKEEKIKKKQKKIIKKNTNLPDR